MVINLKLCGRKQLGPHFSNCLSICVQRRRKPTGCLGQVNMLLGCGLNSRHSQREISTDHSAIMFVNKQN